jgi:hypothetical protein
LPCATLPYVDTKTNSTANCFSNSYTGANNQASNDVWYKFKLTNAATVQVSHCGSAFDTYMHILDSNGTQLYFNDDNGPLCSGLQSSIVATLAAGTYYIVSEGWNTGIGAITTTVKTTDVCPVNSTLNVKCYIEGYWKSLSNNMTPVLANQGISSAANACDSIDVELHAATPPYAKLYSTKTILFQDGNMVCNYPLIYGNFYIALRHRNALQTWSSSPISMSHIPVSYDFTTSNSKAFGSNQVAVAPGVWALYSGDFNSDENIDLLDIAPLETSILNFNFGYYATDLNGDGNVDLLDMPFVETNISNFIFSSHP